MYPKRSYAPKKPAAADKSRRRSRSRSLSPSHMHDRKARSRSRSQSPICVSPLDSDEEESECEGVNAVSAPAQDKAEWTCEKCTYVNSRTTVCAMCQYARNLVCFVLGTFFLIVALFLLCFFLFFCERSAAVCVSRLESSNFAASMLCVSHVHRRTSALSMASALCASERRCCN